MSFCINPNCPQPINKETMLFCQSCGSQLLLDERYRVISEIGKGGFGKTYEVIDCHFDDQRLKVLKVLRISEPKYIELFQREAQVLAQLKHPGIPQVEPDGYFTVQVRNSPENLHCLVMEKIEGLNLKEYIMRRGSPIKEKLAIQWLIELVEILKEVHNNNFFHRDIKPSNIMLRSNSQLVLIDFGSVREVTATYMNKKSAGEITGFMSAGYTPMEQMNGKALPQSDFFALGRSFVYLLTAKDPHEFDDSYSNGFQWRETAPHVSPIFADFLDYLMARSPHNRPQSAEIILQELKAIFHNLYLSKSTLPSQSTANIQSPEKTKVFSDSTVKASTQPQITSFLEPAFIVRCQEELTEFIGPMASIICQRILNKNPQITPAEYITALAQKIPNKSQSAAFQNRLLK